MLRKKSIVKLITIVIILFIPIFARAVNFTQTITLEKDGSGIIQLIYSEKETLVKEKNFVIGNLPFTKEKSDEYFKSGNTTIRLFNVDKDTKDNSLMRVTVGIAFKDVSKLNEMKAFSDAQVTIKNTDSGKVFTYFITPAFTKSNSLDNVYTILNYNGAIISSNGKIAGTKVDWFRGKEFLNTKVIYLVATLESEKKTDSGNSSADGKEKSCGSFGLELPLILLGGFIIFSGKLKKMTK